MLFADELVTGAATGAGSGRFVAGRLVTARDSAS